MSTVGTKVCSIDGCDGAHYIRGWCKKHYGRWRRHGDPVGGGNPRPKRDPVCTVDGCDRRHNRYGFCARHAYRWEQHGDPEGGEVRNVPDGYVTGRGMAQLAGTTYRRLDYWANEGFIPLQGRGSGRFRLYSPEQQRVVCTFTRLVDLGFRPEALAKHDAETQARLLDVVTRVIGPGLTDGAS